MTLVTLQSVGKADKSRVCLNAVKSHCVERQSGRVPEGTNSNAETLKVNRTQEKGRSVGGREGSTRQSSWPRELAAGRSSLQLSMGDIQRHLDRTQKRPKMLQQAKQGSSPKALGKGLHLGKHHRLLGQSAEAFGLLPRILLLKV